jgi:hypothetical protein
VAGGQICVSPSSLDFGNVQVNGTPVTQKVTLQNCGASPVVLGFNSPAVAGPDAAVFSVTGQSDTTLQPGSQMTLTVTFAPSMLGQATAYIPFSDCSRCSELINLSGVGVDCTLGFNPDPVAFGSVANGTTATQTVTVTNTGTNDCAVTGLVTQNGASAFSIRAAPPTPISLPVGLAFSFTIAFSPSAGASDSDNLIATYTVSDPAVCPRTALDPLTGVGTGSSVWTELATTGPGMRGDVAMAFDSAHGETVLFGGFNGTGGAHLGDTWLWNGTAWTQVASTGPSPRDGHSMAFDSSRNKTVLFGGVGGVGTVGYLGDTWEWDGTAWTQVASTGPAPRNLGAMAFDAIQNEAVLFGGRDVGSSTLFGDTWAWNGTTWTQIASGGPSPRYGVAMAFDVARGKLVLFGGFDATGVQGDTWEWDWTSSAWNQLSVAGPSAREQHAMSFDTASGVTLLFGGVDAASDFFGDTWQWNGSTWSEVASTGPSVRCSHAMAFDSARGQTVLFGGYNGTTDLGDTWGAVP